MNTESFHPPLEVAQNDIENDYFSLEEFDYKKKHAVDGKSTPKSTSKKLTNRKPLALINGISKSHSSNTHYVKELHFGSPSTPKILEHSVENDDPHISEELDTSKENLTPETLMLRSPLETPTNGKSSPMASSPLNTSFEKGFELNSPKAIQKSPSLTMKLKNSPSSGESIEKEYHFNSLPKTPIRMSLRISPSKATTANTSIEMEFSFSTPDRQKESPKPATDEELQSFSTNWREDSDTSDGYINELESTIVEQREELNESNVVTQEVDNFAEHVQEASENLSNFSLSTCDFTQFSNMLKNCKMYIPPIQATDKKITSLDIHPSHNKLILLVGDDKGNIHIRDVIAETGVGGKLHANAANCVTFSYQNDMKFFSTSLEGRVIRGDVNSPITDLVYEAPKGEYTSWHDEFGHSLLVGHESGVAKVIDLRTNGGNCVNFNCHNRSIRTIQLHPTNENYFLTASGYGEYAVWDMRYGNTEERKPIVYQGFVKAVGSSFFSPQGNYILATCNDDSVQVFDVIGLQKSNQICNIKHNNHAGSHIVGFKARWQPQREDVFFVGSAAKNPKRFLMYRRNGDLIHELISKQLNTICPIVIAHPTLPIYIGGSRTGKLNVFSSDFSSFATPS